MSNTTPAPRAHEDKFKAMNTSSYQGTAKIYHFPVRQRAAVQNHRNGAEPLPQHMGEAVLEQCWYHDAAIKQADLAKS